MSQLNKNSIGLVLKSSGLVRPKTKITKKTHTSKLNTKKMGKKSRKTCDKAFEKMLREEGQMVAPPKRNSVVQEVRSRVKTVEVQKLEKEQQRAQGEVEKIHREVQDMVLSCELPKSGDRNGERSLQKAAVIAVREAWVTNLRKVLGSLDPSSILIEVEYDSTPCASRFELGEKSWGVDASASVLNATVVITGRLEKDNATPEFSNEGQRQVDRVKLICPTFGVVCLKGGLELGDLHNGAKVLSKSAKGTHQFGVVWRDLETVIAPVMDRQMTSGELSFPLIVTLAMDWAGENGVTALELEQELRSQYPNVIIWTNRCCAHVMTNIQCDSAQRFVGGAEAFTKFTDTVYTATKFHSCQWPLCNRALKKEMSRRGVKTLSVAEKERREEAVKSSPSSCFGDVVKFFLSALQRERQGTVTNDKTRKGITDAVEALQDVWCGPDTTELYYVSKESSIACREATEQERNKVENLIGNVIRRTPVGCESRWLQTVMSIMPLAITRILIPTFYQTLFEDYKPDSKGLHVDKGEYTKDLHLSILDEFTMQSLAVFCLFSPPSAALKSALKSGHNSNKYDFDFVERTFDEESIKAYDEQVIAVGKLQMFALLRSGIEKDPLTRKDAIITKRFNLRAAILSMRMSFRQQLQCSAERWIKELEMALDSIQSCSNLETVPSAVIQLLDSAEQEMLNDDVRVGTGVYSVVGCAKTLLSRPGPSKKNPEGLKILQLAVKNIRQNGGKHTRRVRSFNLIFFSR